MKHFSMTAERVSPLAAADALQRHVQSCARARGHSFALRAWCERAHEALAPRFGTTVAVASMCVVVVALIA
ncbi:MAG: hypothetical protein ABIR94_05690 [Rubrivivax sp.]